MSEIDSNHAMLLVGIMALSTILCRALPFVIFAKSTPSFILFLGKVLPSAIIAMLIIYCLKDTDIFNAPYGLNELIAVCVVIVVHLWLKISALSIICGTICYMYLVQSGVISGALG